MKGRPPEVLTGLMDIIALHPQAEWQHVRDLYETKHGHRPGYSTVRKAMRAVAANTANTAGNGRAGGNPVMETATALWGTLAHAPAQPQPPTDPFAEGVRALGVALRTLGRERVKVLLALLESEP